jgi:hypothetical protein
LTIIVSITGFACGVSNETVYLSSTFTEFGFGSFRTPMKKPPTPLSAKCRSHVYLTSFAVSSLPQFDFTPFRRWKIALAPFFSSSQLVASLG